MSVTRRPHFALRLTVHLVVYGLALTMVVPFLWMVITSLKGEQEALKSPLFDGGLWSGLKELAGFLVPDHWLWSNYARAVQAAELDLFYFNSIVVAVATTVFGVLQNALAGFAFAKMRFHGARTLFWMTLATMMLPMQVYFIFAYVIAGHLNFIDNMQALVVPFLATGFGIYYMRQAISTVPDALLEAGRIDGMTDFELFWNVVGPTIWPAVSALAIFTFVFSWNNFFWPLIVVDSKKTTTLPLAVAQLAAGRFVPSWPVRMAAVTILTVPLILVFLIFQRAFVKGVALTGIKE